jgi:hypothetical protein
MFLSVMGNDVELFPACNRELGIIVALFLAHNRKLGIIVALFLASNRKLDIIVACLHCELFYTILSLKYPFRTSHSSKYMYAMDAPETDANSLDLVRLSQFPSQPQ